MELNTKELCNIIEKLNKVKYTKMYGIQYANMIKSGACLTIYNSDSQTYGVDAKIYGVRNEDELDFNAKIGLNKLSAVLKNFGDTVSVYLENEDIVFTDGNKTFKEKYIVCDKYTFKDYQFKEEVKTLELEKSFTKELFKHIKFVSKDKKRAVLQCVGFRDNYVYSTDSYRAARTNLLDYLKGKECLIGNFTINIEVIKFIKSIKQTIKEIDYNLDDENVVIKLDNGWHITSNKCETTYPSMEKIYVFTCAHRSVLNTNELLKDCKELKPFTTTDNRSVKLDLLNGKIECKGSNNSYEININEAIKEDGFKDDILFNCSYMIDILENINDELFTICFQGSKKQPMNIIDDSSTDYLLLPIVKMSEN